MNERLRVLTRRGHGECLEAIMLDSDEQSRLKRLEDYVVRVPESTKSGRRARRFLANLNKG